MRDNDLPRLHRHLAKALFFTGLVWSSVEHQRLRAIGRWWGWQVWRRLSHAGLEVETPGGAWLWCPAWSEIGGMVAAMGSNEPAEFGFLVRWVRPGDLVVDVGANIGVYAVALASLGARVAAVEPSSSAQRALERSIERNALDQAISVFPSALSDHRGQARFTAGRDVGGRLIDETDTCGDTVIVPLTTLDDLASDPFFDRPLAFVKIDAEGADQKVVEGGLTVLARDRPLLMVEAWTRSSPVCHLLEGLGYQPWRIRKDACHLDDIPIGDSAQNLIFVHPDRLEETLRRLAGGPASQRLPALRFPRRREARGQGPM